MLKRPLHPHRARVQKVESVGRASGVCRERNDAEFCLACHLVRKRYLKRSPPDFGFLHNLGFKQKPHMLSNPSAKKYGAFVGELQFSAIPFTDELTVAVTLLIHDFGHYGGV